MSMETYERKLALVEVYRKLADTQNQLKEGVPLIDVEEVFDIMKGKYTGKGKT